jgi:hypothetical protein
MIIKSLGRNMYKSTSPTSGILFKGIWWLKYAINNAILGRKRVTTSNQVSIIFLKWLVNANITYGRIKLSIKNPFRFFITFVILSAAKDPFMLLKKDPLLVRTPTTGGDVLHSTPVIPAQAGIHTL